MHRGSLRADLGYDFVNRDAQADDDNGRGTELTGVVAAAWNTVQIAGLAPSVGVIPVKILGATGSGTFATAAAGIDWAVAKHARIILFGATATESDLGVRQALERAQAAGALVVAPAGNDHAAVAFPAFLDSVLSVGAIDQADQTAYFSNWGPELDLVAPGVAIRATGATGAVSRSGTDFAAAHVAAVAALYLSVHPEATLSQLRGHLLQSAEDLGPGGYDNHYGYGLVRADWTVE